jgi:hypothetical protein
LEKESAAFFFISERNTVIATDIENRIKRNRCGGVRGNGTVRG